MDAHNKNQRIVCGSRSDKRLNGAGYDKDKTGIVPNHAYSILGAYEF